MMTMNAARRRRALGPWAVAAVIALAAGIAGALVVGLLVSVSSLNPFATTKTERNDAVVLAKLQNLSRYEAATARFQTTVEQETTSKAVPDWVSGERVVLQAEGDVTATVDLSHLAQSVQLSEDGKAATVHLPGPELSDPRLDPGTTRVIAHDRGIVDRVGDAVSGNPFDDSALEQRASDKLSVAASDSELSNRARTNTEQFVRSTLQAAGVDQVTVVFDQPSAAAAA
ncbi:MAG: DUF4230 domain-containing protein [Acidimicrobiales bacterium]